MEQIEASTTCTPMNFVEGKGCFYNRRFVQYCFIARGSLYETVTLLEVFKRKRWISEGDFEVLKSEELKLAAMIKGLISALKKIVMNCGIFNFHLSALSFQL